MSSTNLSLDLEFGKRKSDGFKLYICFYKATREIEPGDRVNLPDKDFKGWLSAAGRPDIREI